MRLAPVGETAVTTGSVKSTVRSTALALGVPLSISAVNVTAPSGNEIGKLLEGIGGGKMTAGGGGSDIGPLMQAGVPGFGVRTVGTHYFDWHHTNADSFDKIVPREFQENVAALAVLSYVLADMPERIGEMK